MKQIFLVAICLLAAFLLPGMSLNGGLPAAASSNATSSNGTAADVVEGLHNLLIRSMKMGNKIDCSKRFKLLEPYILRSFDFPLISRIILGHYWKKMDGEKRKAFVDAFARMTVATYADRFDSYSGETFKTLGSGMDKMGHLRVETILVKKDGEEISLNYTCRQKNGMWKIVGVSAKGVNDLSLKRADYSSFLKDHTIDQLIAKLRDQTGRCISNRGETA